MQRFHAGQIILLDPDLIQSLIDLAHGVEVLQAHFQIGQLTDQVFKGWQELV